MSKFIGLDLGTNSIGWGIRDINLNGNQFIDFDENEKEILNSGVLIFKKGVGDGKSGEYSLAAERRSHRSKRRLYNAKRYRKWATLKVLSKNISLVVKKLSINDFFLLTAIKVYFLKKGSNINEAKGNVRIDK